MKWFMRLTDEGVGMHVGILPGYPASHGCIRMHNAEVEQLYPQVSVGDHVVIVGSRPANAAYWSFPPTSST